MAKKRAVKKAAKKAKEKAPVVGMIVNVSEFASMFKGARILWHNKPEALSAIRGLERDFLKLYPSIDAQAFEAAAGWKPSS